MRRVHDVPKQHLQRCFHTSASGFGKCIVANGCRQKLETWSPGIFAHCTKQFALIVHFYMRLATALVPLQALVLQLPPLLPRSSPSLKQLFGLWGSENCVCYCFCNNNNNNYYYY